MQGGGPRIRIGVGDGPQGAVLDDVPAVGGEGPIIPSGGHDIAGVELVAVTTGDGLGGVEIAAFEARRLDRRVEAFDFVVGGGGDRHRLPHRGVVEPLVGDHCRVLVKGAGADAVVVLVGGDDVGVTVSQRE